ncbi:hypothetical protein EW145_g8618, partial [Phellinidium pouzarii]
PLLRGRALPRIGMGSRNGSVGPGSCEPGVMELSTVFDEGEGDVSSSSNYRGMSGMGAAALGLRLVPAEVESSVGHSCDEQSGETGQDTEHDRDLGEGENDDSESRSQSMVRKRKRGARRGKGQIIQQQQLEIARLQQEKVVMEMQQEEMARRLRELQMQQQQHHQVNVHAQSLPPLGPLPAIPSAAASIPIPDAQLPAASVSGDNLDTLASASEALARELSRASRDADPTHASSSSSSAFTFFFSLPLEFVFLLSLAIALTLASTFALSRPCTPAWCLAGPGGSRARYSRAWSWLWF